MGRFTKYISGKEYERMSKVFKDKDEAKHEAMILKKIYKHDNKSMKYKIKKEGFSFYIWYTLEA